MQTKIVTLSGVLFEGESKAVNAKTQSGEITLLDHHQPLITALAKESRVKVEKTSGEHEEFGTKGGFLHMNADNTLTILVD
jgi:F0F1-type ATP synthase epsilon subunit